MVQPDDYCQLASLNQSVSLTLFEAINPSINSRCTNLVAGFHYCLAPTENWNANAAVHWDMYQHQLLRRRQTRVTAMNGTQSNQVTIVT